MAWAPARKEEGERPEEGEEGRQNFLLLQLEEVRLRGVRLEGVQLEEVQLKGVQLEEVQLVQRQGEGHGEEGGDQLGP